MLCRLYSLIHSTLSHFIHKTSFSQRVSPLLASLLFSNVFFMLVLGFHTEMCRHLTKGCIWVCPRAKEMHIEDVSNSSDPDSDWCDEGFSMIASSISSHMEDNSCSFSEEGKANLRGLICLHSRRRLFLSHWQTGLSFASWVRWLRSQNQNPTQRDWEGPVLTRGHHGWPHCPWVTAHLVLLTCRN